MDRRYYAIAGAAFAGVGLIVSATGAAGGASPAQVAPAARVKAPTKRQVKVIARTQANKVVTARAPGLSVAAAESARPTGAAGGSLSGTFPNPLLAAGSVTTPRLADDAVTAAKLADGSVDNAALQGAPIAARNLMEGAVTAHTLGTVALTTSLQSVPAGQAAAASATCPAGSRLVSGGGLTASNFMVLVSSYPQSDTKWRAVYRNSDVNAHSFSVVASCLEPMGG